MVPYPEGGQGGNWPEPKRAPWIYNVSVGGRSVGFRGGSHFPPTTGGPVGTYTPITPSGASLVYTGTTTSNGRYVFTDGDGSVIDFVLGYQPTRIEDWTMPDGTRFDFTYDTNGRLVSVFSNRGYALLFESAPSTLAIVKICAVNRAQFAVTPTSSCPAGAQNVTYTYTSGTFNPYLTLLASATDATGQTTTYGYVTPDRLGCITLPGQSACQIQNSYQLCYAYDPTYGLQYRGEYVVSQQSATGETYGYNYQFPWSDPPSCGGTSIETTLTVNGTSVTHATPNAANLPTAITDPLGRTTSFAYNMGEYFEAEPAQLADVTYPMGNAIHMFFDDRGNMVRREEAPVTAPAAPNLVSRAEYPTTCVDRKTCNQPTSVIDARDGRTDYTYDPAHGGVLTVTGPAVNGVRPQTRHNYAQRYAWILAAGGGYAQAPTPVWVRTATSTCRTSAATGNPAAPCAVAGDEVLTQYDYGPNSGPNTLLLRGQTVTATDGVTTTFRTCYGYDRDGRRISETQPNANLGSCP
jgi:YD repeat-containing protein